MKKQLIAAGVACASIFTLAAGNDDPVLMNIAGKDVHLSEFEYLYHKNNTQQATPQTVDEYLGMFIDYKLKVADAEAEGIDTTAAFIGEFVKFRDELADPYMQDNDVLESLIKEAYNHKSEDLLVSHIMMPTNEAATLDSLRRAIVDGKVTFEDVAMNYSMDAPSARQGGLMGIVTPGRYPWAFEEMAYNTPTGEISEVVYSGFGQHIIRVEKRTPAKGEVKARHILKLTRGGNQNVVNRQKEIIDSIYELVKISPDRFEELAKELSDDPGSGRRGGDLGWFGSGQMVAEFDSVSFAMPVGTISAPFKTAFGWHIIKKEDERGVGTYEENREALLQQIKSSDRGNIPRKAYMDEMVKRFNARLLPENIKAVALATVDQISVLDSAGIAIMSVNKTPLYTVGGKNYTFADIAPLFNPIQTNDAQLVEQYYIDRARKQMESQLANLSRELIADRYPEYRNLVNEYRDGILLFEVSNRNVWDKASKDKQGLEEYFQAHKDKYVWENPKFKSFVIFTTTDSLLNAALEYAATLPSDMAPTDFTKTMRERFGRDIKIERVIAAKGENAITDYLGFNAEKPDVDNGRWKYYAAFGGRIISQPEEAADVRGAAVADYQDSLEKQWVSDLHKRYKVKVNNKVLKKVK